VPATILSRCQRFDFRRIPVQQIAQRLQKLADAEDIHAEPEALALIARSATGSLRDAESLLDQLAAANAEGITLAQIQSTLGTIDAQLVVDLIDSLVQGDVATGLALIDRALDQGADLRQFARQIVSHLRGMLLIQLQGAELLDLGSESIQALTAQAEQIPTPALVQAIKRFSQAETELKGGWQPQLPLELALVEAAMPMTGEVVAAPAVASQPARVREVAPSYQIEPEPVAANVETERPSPVQRESTDPPPANVVAEDGLTLEAVQRSWRQVLEGVRARDRSVQALLNSTRPAVVQGGLVILHVAHDFARSKLSQGRAKRLVEETLSQVLGQSCQVDYKVVAFAEETSSADPTAGTFESAPREGWADDPLVQAARQMGAEVRLIDEGRET